MQTNKTHWPSLLTLLIFCFSILFLLLIAFGVGASSLFSLFANKVDPTSQMISAYAFGFEILILLACSWFVLQKAMHNEQADQPFHFPFENWQIIAILAIVIFSVIFGGVVAYVQFTWLSWLILPLLTLLVIAPPIWMLFGIGTNKLELGPRWRVFAIFGLGMTVGPLIMIVLEIVALLAIFLGAAVYTALAQPVLFQELSSLFNQITTETDQQFILSALSPYITNPFTIAAAIGYIAFLVPLIEELLKPLAVWLFVTRIETPAQGFSMGMLSGGAFALIESLNASADGTTSWPVIVSVRAGTSLLHMTVSGLVGWGIVSAYKEKRVGRLIGAYFAAVLIHGIWNACAAGIGLSAIGESIGKPEWLFRYAPALISGLFVLGFGMLAVLLASNWKLKKSIIAPANEKSDNEESVQLPA